VDLPLTVSDSAEGVEHDLLVRCDPSAPVGDVMAAVVSEINGTGAAPGLSPTAPVYLGANALQADTSVGRAGLRPGALLTVGAAAAPAGRPEGTGVRYQLAIVGGLLAGLAVDLGDGALNIGRSGGCDVVLPDEDVSRLHASITLSGDVCTIEDLHSSNGTTVNGVPIHVPTVVGPADLIGIGGSVLTLRPPAGPTAECEPAGDGRLRFNKPPRRLLPAADPTFELPEEPQPVQARHFSMVAMLSPLAIGLVTVVLFHQVAFLLFSLASPLMLGANALSDRRTGRRTYAKRVAEYEKARDTLSARLERAVRDEEQSRRTANPDPAAVAAIAIGPTQQLWERRPADPDFLVARIGLADCPANIKLVAGPRSPTVDPPLARTVPITVPILASGVVGVAGPRTPALNVVRSLVVQLATLHSPNDLVMVLLCTEAPEGWNWIKWLPHTVPSRQSGVTRLVATSADQRRARIDELVTIVDNRLAASGRRLDGDGHAWPTILLLLDDVRSLRAEQGVAYLLQEGPGVGMVALCVAGDPSSLPAEASVSVEVRPGTNTEFALGLTTESALVSEILPDGLDEDLALEVSRALAPLFEVAPRSGTSSELPSPPVNELELLHMETPTADAILERWGPVSRNDRLPAILGVTEEGPFMLDVCRDGPHVLLAGTTGAGKSELLQTLVASLAATTRNDALTFLLVDFKGGSAFKDCARLPHNLGLISNLDGRLVERALDSLQAELRWRQAMFNEVAAKEYEEYAALRPPERPAMPRLVVVVDELKELSDAYSQAIVRLNQTARLGRSLGVHLVLGTQKPSLVPGLGDLRANTDLRLCLRVQDESDSGEMVNVPDAASIRRADVGRGIARLSDGSLLAFQTGYLGGRVRSETPQRTQRIEVEPFDITFVGALPRSSSADDTGNGDSVSRTRLQALVEAVIAAADRLELPAPRLPWLPPLPTSIQLGDPRLSAPERVPVFPVGLTDLPDQQRQEPLLLNFDELTHVLVIGPSRSGRSTFLRTLAASVASRVSPADVHLYCLEFRRPTLGDLDHLPHCGAVVGVGDLERLERCLLFLETELERRATLMRGYNSVADQRASVRPDEALPYIIVLCDNYEAFHERFSYEDGGRLVDRFGALLSDGPASGVHFVVTTDRRGLQSRLGTSIEARLLLRPTDRDDQLALGVSTRTLPFDLPPGRGFWYQGPAEIQVATLAPPHAGGTQMEAIAAVAEEATARSGQVDGRRLPRRVPPLPMSISVREGEQLRQSPRRTGRGVVTVGIAGVEAVPADIDLAEAGGTFVVSGPRGSGRSTALLTVATSLVRSEPATRLCVLTPRRSPLRELHGLEGADVLTSTETMAGDLTDLLATVSGPVAIIVDDAELLLDTPVATRLDRVTKNASDNDWLIVIGGTTADLARRFSGWIFDARQSRSGILLQPSSVADGEVLDLRLPRSTGSGQPTPPGRGILAIRGRWTTVQVFLPDPSEPSGSRRGDQSG
jgi:S-DNA-T family DNA segregation ATPase FtsK/SpoIIIE